MSMAPVESWNLDFAAIGAVVGVASMFSHRLVQTRAATPLLAMAVAAARGHVPWSAVLALGLLVWASGSVVGIEPLHGTWRFLADAATIVLIVGTSSSSGALLVVILAASASVPIWLGRRLPADLPPRLLSALTLVAVVACWVSAPDTEVVLLVGGAMAIAVWSSRGPGDQAAPGPVVGWDVAVVGLLLAAASGFEGRPPGAAILIVIVATVCGRAVALVLPRANRHVSAAIARTLIWTVGAFAAVSCLAAARTIGLSDQASQTVPWAGSVALLLLSAWWSVPVGPRPAQS